MNGQVVLVTGGAGYIGSHACKALARGGYRPVAYDSLVYSHDWAVKRRHWCRRAATGDKVPVQRRVRGAVDPTALIIDATKPRAGVGC